MKKIFIIILTSVLIGTLSSSYMFAQTWSEVLSPTIDFDNTGFSGIETVRVACRDSSDNIYVAGDFDQIIKFGNITLIAETYQDMFIAKFNSSGQWEWAKLITGGLIETATGIAADNNGSVFLCGNYQEETKFDNITLEKERSQEMFVAKINSDGQWQWVESCGSMRSDKVTTLAVGTDGSCYIAGMLATNGTFGSITTTSNGGQDIFIAKIGSAGLWSWAKSIGGASTDQATKIICENNRLFLTGYFSSTAIFGSTTLISAGYYDAFLAEFNSLGVYQWAISAGGTSYDFSRDLCYDNGQVFWTGQYDDNMDIGSNSLTSTGYYDFFCASYTPGSGIDWAFSGGGTNDDDGKTAYVNDNGVFFGASYHEAATIGTNTLTGRGGNDLCLIKANKATGNIIEVNNCGSAGNDKLFSAVVLSDGTAKLFGTCEGKFYAGLNRANATESQDVFMIDINATGGITDNDYLESASLNNVAYSGVVDAAGNRYMAGRFYGALRFGNNVLLSAGKADAFLAKANSAGDWVWAVSFGGVGNDEILDMKLDNNGDLIMCGTFYENIWVTDQPIEAEGLNDAFVAKFDTDGYLIWVNAAGTADFDDKASAVGVDANNNIYVTGEFLTFTNEKAHFGSIAITGKGLEDIFVAKLNSTGTWQWATSAGGEDVDYALDIAVAPDGNAYVVGRIEGSYTFGTITGGTYGYDDGFIAKINASGVWQKAVNAGSYTWKEEIKTVALDKNNKLYVGGIFTKGTYFKGSTFVHTSNADKQSYLGVLNSDLEWQSLEIYGNNTANAYTAITAIEVDDIYEKIYLCGVSNDDITINGTQYNNVGKYDLFYEKKNFALSTQYSAYIGGAGDDIAYSIFPWSSGETFIAGQYSHNAVVGSNTLPLQNSFDAHAFMVLNEYIPDPPPWTVPELSANTAVVNITKAINPQVNGHDLNKGDAIGVFYREGSNLKCAGYAVYMKNDLQIVVRGDNPATTSADGCPDGALYLFKTWDGGLQEEFTTDMNIAQGPRRFVKDAQTTLKYLPMQDVYSQEITLEKGWNMLSSYIAPRNPDVTTVIANSGNPDDVYLMKDQNGNICLPSLGINTIGVWDERHGSLVYMLDAAKFTIYGDSINVATEYIPLSAGWNIISVWHKTTLDINTALSGISSSLYLVKDENGNINLPSLGIKQINNLEPGKAYLLYMTNDATLRYD